MENGLERETKERDREMRHLNSESKRYFMANRKKRLDDLDLKKLAIQDRKERRKRKKLGIPMWVE
jgi:hypothetical protein